MTIVNALTDDTADDTQAVSTETIDTSAAAPAGKKSRNSNVVDVDAGTLTIRDPGGAVVGTHSLNGVPEHVRTWLALRYLGIYLSGEDNHADAMTLLRDGVVPGRNGAPKGPRRAEPTDWHRAIAAAMQAESKKAGTPMSAEDALVRAQQVKRADLLAAKKHPEVVRHYQRLTGAAPASLLSLGA